MGPLRSFQVNASSGPGRMEVKIFFRCALLFQIRRGPKIFKKKILSSHDSVGKYLYPRTTIPLTKTKKDLKEVLRSLFRQPTTPLKNFFADPSSWEREKIFFVSGETRL